MNRMNKWLNYAKRAIGIRDGLPVNVPDNASPGRLPVIVTEETALTLSAFWRAATVLSEAIGTMPLKYYQYTDTGRAEARDENLWTLLHDETNEEMSSIEFFTLIVWFAILYGTGYAEIERNGAGEVIAMWPINPSRVTPMRIGSKLIYRIMNVNAQPSDIPANDMLVLKGPSPDNSAGYRICKIARESLSFSMACDRFGNSYFANNCIMGGWIKTVGQVSDNARVNLVKSMEVMNRGVDNVGKWGLLEEGMDAIPNTVSNEAGEYTETRQAQIYEICRWLGVDPIFVYEFGRATWNNAEAQTRNFLQFSLNPWLRKLETEISRKVIRKADKNKYYAEFVRESIIQMDALKQNQIWQIQIQCKIRQPNEIRALMNLEPLDEIQPELGPALQPAQQPTDTIVPVGTEEDGTPINQV